MSELTPELVEQMLPVCEQNAGEISEALTRGIDTEVTVSNGNTGKYDPQSPPEGFNGGGLVLKLQFGNQAMAAVLPETSGLVQDWMRKPDKTDECLLNTLAQELSMLVVPETMMSDQFGGLLVDDLSATLSNAEFAEDASLHTLELTHGDKVAHLTLLWPCSAPDKLLPAPKPQPTKDKPEAKSDPAPTPKPSSIEELPTYARHLLKISVPVSVRLVGKKMSVQEILDLGPGAMVSFDKSCDDTLELVVGDNTIARGSAVKVGEQFGIEVVEMTMPEEHFYSARR